MAGTLLAARQPVSLVNYPGIRVIGGLPQPGPPFVDEDLPLRVHVPLTVQLEDFTTRLIQSPVSNSIPGAMAIQRMLDNYEWVSHAGSPLAFAPHLRKAPLRGVPAKPILFQIAEGDETAPNPSTTAMLRAGDLRDRFATDGAVTIEPTPARYFEFRSLCLCLKG